MGRRCNFIVLSVSGGYTTKQALVAHLRARHGPPPALGESMYVLCAEKGFKVLMTMREPMASLKGPFPCWVDGCTAGPFFFSFLNTWLKSMGPLLVVSNGVAYYMCVLGLQWSLLYLIVWEIGGGGNQATGQVTSHLLLTPILIVLVTCMVSSVVTGHLPLGYAGCLPLGCVGCLPLGCAGHLPLVCAGSL